MRMAIFAAIAATGLGIGSSSVSAAPAYGPSMRAAASLDLRQDVVHHPYYGHRYYNGYHPRRGRCFQTCVDHEG
jgi:hypothetical protein